MNRLDATQMSLSEKGAPAGVWMIWTTYGVAVAGCLGAAVVGSAGAANPTDRFFASAAALPAALLMVDVWAIVVAITRRHASTPLRIPSKTPLILGLAHLAAWALSAQWSSFEYLYELVWVSERVGHYQIKWGSATLVILLGLLSFVLALFETRLVRWVLVSEITAIDHTASDPVVVSEDIELGAEHVYEAQVMLNNLGYNVSPITGELAEPTVAALRRFQSEVDLTPDGSLTAKTIIELRNRWNQAEGDPSAVVAVSEHAVRRAWSRIKQVLQLS
jgi:hypothetical protein